MSNFPRSLFHPRLYPSLPQSNNPAQLKVRKNNLATAQSRYQWDTKVKNLEGVPMLLTNAPLFLTPFFETPQLGWWAKAGVTAATAELNGPEFSPAVRDIFAKNEQQANPLPHLDEKIATLQSNLNKAQNAKEQPGDSIQAMGAVLESAYEDISKVNASMQAIQTAHNPQLIARASPSVNALQGYTGLFRTIPKPKIVNNYCDDASFARLRVAGPNPMLIKGIAALPDNFPLTAEQYASVMEGDALGAAAQEGRLYLLDYVELALLAAAPSKPKQIPAPIALFAVPRNGKELTPVAIQCGQDAADFPLFLKPRPEQTELKYGWLMAKYAVQVADAGYHELLVHLARTHLVQEAFAIATHRQLAPGANANESSHPLWILLFPHFEGSLFINNSAAHFLINPGGIIDNGFGARIGVMQKAAIDDRLNFDFYARMLPDDLKARKVDDTARLPVYPYRDDALLVWDAISQWVSDYVALYYANDAAVQGDTELAAWCRDLMTEGKIKGFTPITSLAQLVKVLTMVIFNGSAQHAAVNFPQSDIMTYTPASTGALWSALPAQQAGQSEADWLAMMPPIGIAGSLLKVLYILGTVNHGPIGTYQSYSLFIQWFGDWRVDAPLAKFKAGLCRIEAEIKRRNEERGDNSYPYLLPSRIPLSINI